MYEMFQNSQRPDEVFEMVDRFKNDESLIQINKDYLDYQKKMQNKKK